MMRIRAHHRAARALIASAVLAALATGCADSATGTAEPDAPSTAAPATPGQVTAQGPGVDLRITHAVAHLGSSGAGTLAMTVYNGGDAPDHLDMVGTPGGGRGTLEGARDGVVDGSLSTAGVLIPVNSTVTFGSKSGPVVRLPAGHGATAAHTLPLVLEFGNARLVHLTARVATH
jgi:hypothetical protein